MCNRIAHRGPDAEGFFFDRESGIGLGHRRLSIIDLSENANQPMFSHDGRLVIIFNGEIYNYSEIKRELQKEGCVFRTDSDTEVILESFRLWGPCAIDRFIGMFAFAIYDREKKELYIARDRVGIKPLYYYQNEDEFYFSSELKALISQLAHKEINADAVADFFRFGYINSDRSIFRGVQKLLPGHYIRMNAEGQWDLIKYWSIEDSVGKQAPPASIEKATEELESIMYSAFNYRMVADVPVGVFLSGGVDSSSLAAVLAKDHRNLKTFSIGFDDEKYNEAPYARKIASYLGTQHHESILTASDAEKVMNDYFTIYDEPFADSSGIPVFLISRFAKDNGCKVVLSADGGDELFGGYERYSSLPSLHSRLAQRKYLLKLADPLIGGIGDLGGNIKNIKHRTSKLRDLVSSIGDSFSLDFYESYLGVVSDSFLQKLIMSRINDSPDVTFHGNMKASELMMLWDFKNYLPNDLLVKVDRASMAMGIEAREPFLDHRLIEFAFNLPAHWRLHPSSSKYLLKKVLFKHIPPQYFDRKKMGFSIPMFKWFSQQLDKEFECLFTPEVLKSIPILNPRVVLAEYKKYKYFKSRQKEYNMLFMWHLFVFIKWWHKWM